MPETADRTETLFAAAVTLAPAERDAYLEREFCSGDACCATAQLCSELTTEPVT